VKSNFTATLRIDRIYSRFAEPIIRYCLAPIEPVSNTIANRSFVILKQLQLERSKQVCFT
jgi:hypothetical protein